MSSVISVFGPRSIFSLCRSSIQVRSTVHTDTPRPRFFWTLKGDSKFGRGHTSAYYDTLSRECFFSPANNPRATGQGPRGPENGGTGRDIENRNYRYLPTVRFLKNFQPAVLSPYGILVQEATTRCAISTPVRFVP